ncbi:MAG: Gfo/Idh/MocA family oxidoreductase [Actinobacteria bacterium]|nr:Gfo/Idh/MocA family oxidoreductase [Cyanobacteriota bacterium]MCL5985068.1 Gfo/Idh/MocA family oxidoreductase [Actinomycetota bacterium]
MIRVGVIGAGSMGRNHARVYSELPEVDLIGISDLDSDIGLEIANKFGTKYYSDYMDLIEKRLDAISIAVPPSNHFQVAKEVAKRGTNILIEKPIADNLEKAREIISICNLHKVKLMVGHTERFNPIIKVIKQSIGNSHPISINITRVGPFPPKVKDVGIIVDLAVHDIDLIYFLTNSSFKKIYCLKSINLSEFEDTAVLCFEMSNGTLAQITTNWLTPFKVREIIVATLNKFIKGWFIDQKVVEYSKFSEDGSYITKELNVPYAEPLKNEIQSFINSIVGNKDVEVSGDDGLRALEIAIKCKEGKVQF